MKTRLMVTILLFLMSLTECYAEIYDFSDKAFQDTISNYAKEHKEDVNLEAEIKKFLKEDECPISLDEALDIALRNNFDIKARYETYKSYEHLYKYRLAKFLPDFNYQFYSVYYKGQVLVGSALVDKLNELALSSVISVTHSLTEGGRQIFEAKEAKFKKRENREYFNYTKEEVLKETAVSYFQLLQAKIDIEIYLKNLSERMVQLKLIESLSYAGMSTKFDVIRQKNEVASAKRSLVEAMNKFRLTQARLSDIMGIEIETPLYPIENEVKTLNLVDKDISIKDLFEVADNNRKDIKAIRNEIMAMKNEKRAIYTDFAPKPRLVYQNQNQGTARIGLGEANIAGVYVDFALGESLGVGTVQKARAMQHEINSKVIDLTNRLRKIKESLLESYYNSKLLLRRIEITSEQVEYATESAKLAEKRFDAGVGILLDVIEAQNQRTIARVENLQAIIEYNINQVELLFDEGIIDIEKIVENYNP